MPGTCNLALLVPSPSHIWHALPLQDRYTRKHADSHTCALTSKDTQACMVWLTCIKRDSAESALSTLRFWLLCSLKLRSTHL